MVTAPLHPREIDRLAALARYAILDSGRDQAFDDLVALAAAVCGTPMALVSFVDRDRQWFKASQGVSERQTPREIAFCAHAILDQSGVFVVPDAHADKRFADSPLVTSGPLVRGYAAAVIESSDHLPLGALCVMDHEPLALSSEQLANLRRIAGQVSALLDLRWTSRALQREVAAGDQAARELATSEEQYRTLVEHAQGLICAHTLDGRLLAVNQGASRLLGFAQGELIGRNLRELIPAEFHDAFEAYLRSIEANGRFEGVLTLQRADGGRVALAYQNFLRETADGRQVVGHGIDITDRLRAQRAVAQSEQRFRRVVENVREALFETDADGRWTFVNQAWTELTGFSAEETLGRTFWEFLHPEEMEYARQHFLAAGAGNWTIFRGDARYLRRDGSYIWVSVSVRAILDEQGHCCGTFGTLSDITEQRALAEALRRRSEEALAASRMKSEFVANMSHEIRTPINGVMGLMSLLLDTSLTPAQREYALGAHHSAETLLTIVNDVLDLSKIEAGHLTIDPRPFELRPMVEHTLAPLAQKAATKGIELHCRYGCGVPAWLRGDAVRLRQIIGNLVDNAVKFTNHGSVGVSIDASLTAGATAHISITVNDTGIGIPADRIEAVFEQFVQGDASTTRRFGGTGLGLAICRKLARLMGGDVRVTSREGWGSTFVVEIDLPVASAQSAVQPAPSPREQVARTVLLAEDNRINQLVATRLLEQLGCRVEVVADGADALARVQRTAYDAIFMDGQMPGMDGYEATRRIRRIPGLERLPIVAMTASAMVGDREACLAAGMTDYLAKPIDPAKLRAVVTGIAAARQTAPASNLAPKRTFDAALLHDTIGRDPATIAEFVGLVATSVNDTVRAIEFSAAIDDWAGVRKHGHFLEGSVGAVGAEAVMRRLAVLRDQLSAQNISDARVTVSSLRDIVWQLLDDLRAWSAAPALVATAA